MADKNTVKITVPVEFQAELNSLKKIESSLKETLNKTNPGSALAKELTASLTKLRPMIAEYEKLSISPEIDMTGINRMQTLFQSIMREFEKTTSRMEFAPLENILPQEALNRINQLKTELAELQKQYTNIEKHGSTEQATAYLTRTNKEDIIAAARKTGKYRGEATLGQNVDIFAKEIENSKTNAAILTDKAMALGEQYQQLENDLETAKATLQEKWIAQARTQKAADQAAFYSGIGGFDIRYNSKTGERPTSGSLLTGQLEKMLRSSEFSDSGYLKGNMQSLMVQMLKDMNFDETEATAISKMQLDPMISAIRQHFSVTIDELNEAMPVAMMQAFEQAKGKASSRLAELKRQTEEQGITDINAANAKAHQAYKNQEKEVNKLKGETDAAFTKYEAVEYAADEANKATADFEFLHAALAAVAKEAQEAALALKKEEKEKKESEVERVQTEEREKVQKPTKTSGVDPDAGRDNMAAGRDTANYQLNQKSQQQLEAEQFTANLKQSIKQWMSVSQVINLVKNGIRQAYQDIQGLDKAMTNIAVVTDMSIGDLWGKINDYMSVAQQYGVSTQGVYEVSQLYYQQGLGTADVMAATTETLKMARIAGMDYAEAADAMTVAIRSFKMEMSDAAHVTDVYSKVAAVTASDSEELAIAMSKTASSAESVGSSFENTTAMLAVMIETTRESAQNLGSALKSIISRYGEMKVGLTVDSEGEDIDYNKVDTALKSVGISIKDAQGQFRDFDEVIFELSEKWDGLDKNTQRYIATIMAGNRQQSRFIALVDNWERLDEVAGAAENSEDAGLLQYAKTLDSLETKINNIKTSFQEFYMSIINGPLISSFLDFINKVLQGFNQLGTLGSIINIISIVRGIKSGLTVLTNTFSNSYSSIITKWKSTQKEWLNLAITSGRKRGYEEGKAEREGYEAGRNGQSVSIQTSTPNISEQNNSSQKSVDWFRQRSEGDGSKKASLKTNSWNNGIGGKVVSVGGAVVGSALSAGGAAVAQDNALVGSLMSAGGAAAQGASMGAVAGPWGALIGALIGALTEAPAVFDAINDAAREEINQLKKEVEEKDLERAKKTDAFKTLGDYINKYTELNKNKNRSADDYQAWLDINAEIAEKYPQYVSSMDAAGNAIVNLTKAEEDLASARTEALQANKEYYDSQVNLYERIIHNASTENVDKINSFGRWISDSLTGRSDSTRMQDVLTNMASGEALNAYEFERGAWSTVDKALSAGLPFYGLIRYAITGESGYTQIDEALLDVDRSVDLNALKQNFKSFNLFSEETQKMLAENSTDMTVLDFVTAAKEIGATSASELKYLHSKYGSLSEEQALAQGATETQYLKVFLAKMMDENGLLDLDKGTFSETFEEAVNLSMSKRQLAMAKKGQITSGIELQMSYSDYGEKFEDISGYSLIMTQLAENIENFDASVERHFNQVVGVVADAYNNLRGSKKTKFETLMTNLDTYSINELDELFISLWGQNYEITHKEITDAIKQQFASDTYLSNERFIRAFVSEDAQEGLLSLEDYASTIGLEATSDEAKVAYQEYLSNLAQINQDIATLYFNMSQQEKDWYSSTVAELEDVINDEETTENQKDTAKAQRDLMYEYSKKLGEDVFSQEFQHSFSTDTGTGDWARNLWQNEDFHDELKLLGINSFEQLQEYVYENFSTYIGSLGDTVQSSIDSAKKFSESQEKGFDFDQALKLFNEIAEEGESWEDIFTYTEDGKLVLRNFEESMSRRYNLTIEELKSMNNAYKNGSKNLQEFLNNKRLSAWRYLTKEDLQGFGYTDEQIDDIINWINDDENEEATKEDFIAYLQSKGMALEEAERFYEENVEAILKEQRETDFKTEAKNAASALEGEFDPIKQAWQIIASKGISEYSSSEAGELIAAGLFTQEDFTEALDGTYNLTAAAQEKLASMPVWIQNSVNQRIIESIDAARSSMESLATNIGSGKVAEADYVEAFSVLQDEGLNLEDIVNGVQYALMSAVAGNTKQLKTLVTKQIAKTKRISYDAAAAQYATEINKTVDTMAASFKDGYIERIKKYNDLLYEKIVGTASFSELEELEGLGKELNLNLEDFTGRLIDDLSTFAQAIIDNSYLSAEEKNKYLQDTYRSMLGADAYAQSYGLDPNNLNQDAVNRIADLSDATSMMLSSKNRMSLDQASEYAAALSNMVGIPSSVLRNAFNYNESDSTFSYNFSAGMTARDLQLKMLVETAKISENEEVSDIANSIEDFNAFLADAGEQAKLVSAALQSGDTALLSVLGTSLSTYEELAQSGAKAEAFGKEARVNKFASSVEEFAGGQETTLEELTNLYSELGFTLSLDDAKKLLAQGPQIIAEHLIELANTAGYTDEDMAIIEDAMERGTQTLLEKLASVIDAAIEGTASFEDLTSLAKNAGIDLRGKVLKTAKGYGLTQEGVLAVSAARAGLSGDYAGEAQSLIEHYWGRQGLFSSEAAIESALGGATMEQYQTSVDEATSAYLEANDKYIELLNKEETLIDDTTLAQRKAEVDEKKRLKNEAELQQHQAKVLLEAQKAYRKVAADKAANFMNEDPFKGATDTFATYLSSRDAARTAIEEAYKNNGLIDYTQAGKLINFIGYGAGWEPDQFLAAQQAILNANTEEGVNILSVMRQLVPELENLSDIEIWEEFGKLMDSSQKKMIEEEQAAISANQAFLKQYREQAKVFAAAQTEEDYKLLRARAGKLQPKKGETIKLSSLADDLRQTYGWNENQLTNDTIKELVQTTYGDEWQTVLADQEKLVEFLKQFNSLMSNFTYDESSTLSAEEQFNAYLKGETAAQEVNERLESLQAQLDGLVANPKVMDGFSTNVDSAIEKVKELNELLYKTGMGFAWNTQIDGKTIVGTILTNESDITEAMGDANRESDIWESIATAHGFSKDKVVPEWLKTDDGKVTGVNFEYEGYDYTYNFETFENIPGIGKDPNNEITYSGNFDEINTWLANNKDIIGTIVYKTPQEAFDSMEKQINEIDNLINSLGDGESVANGIYAGYDKESLKILKRNITARQEAMKAAYGDTLEDNNGTLKVQTSFQINPDSDEWESEIKPRLDDLQGAGTVQVAFTYNGEIFDSLEEAKAKYGELAEPVTVSLAFAPIADSEDAKAVASQYQEILGLLNKHAVEEGKETTPVTLNVEVIGATSETATLITQLKDSLTDFPEGDLNSQLTITGGDVESIKGQVETFQDSLDEVPDLQKACVVNFVDEKGNKVEFPSSGEVAQATGEGTDSSVLSATTAASAIATLSRIVDTTANDVLLSKVGPSLPSSKAEQVEEETAKENGTQDVEKETTGSPRLEEEDFNYAKLETDAKFYTDQIITDDNIEVVNSLLKTLEEERLKYSNNGTPESLEKSAHLKELQDALDKRKEETYYEGLSSNEPTEVDKNNELRSKPTWGTDNISQAKVFTGDYTGRTLIAGKYSTAEWNNMSKAAQDAALNELASDRLMTAILTGEIKEADIDTEKFLKYYIYGPHSSNVTDDEYNNKIAYGEENLNSYYSSVEALYDAIDAQEDEEKYSQLENQVIGLYGSLYSLSSQSNAPLIDRLKAYMQTIQLYASYIKEYENLSGEKFEGYVPDANLFTENIEEVGTSSPIEVKKQAEQQKKEMENQRALLQEELDELIESNKDKEEELNEDWEVNERDYNEGRIDYEAYSAEQERIRLTRKDLENSETDLSNQILSIDSIISSMDEIIGKADEISVDVDIKEALTEIGELQGQLDELITAYNTTISITVKEEVVSSENKALPTISRNPRLSGQTQPVYLSKAAGNVNGIALAKGNVTSLINGAKIANKTLVGELGPELGVWDGQYHLLGQYGAEFVDVPSDAIVFNHKQTKGIVNGQWGHRGKALSEGNIKNNPLETPYVLDSWGALWGYSSFGDLINDLGKGSNKQINATITEDLEEWYNLLRKIAKLKAEISLIEAERANMLSGHEILRNYREQQALLHEQIATQKLLIEYQKEQLKLESDRIKQNEFWGKSLTFNEDGTLLSIFGNEANGGRGVFAFLDQLNELSGKQQVAMLEKLGYAYKDREGKSLEGEELVKQFIAEYKEIVSHYNELDDSILSAESTVEELITSINDLEQKIKDNQKELEQSVYDILVEVAEREIEQIENQNALLKEANEKYVQGLTNALNKEQSLYEQNNAISNRESLQRQLSLLRRSGGSASEIEELERQLDETLKAEYFESQQKMIEDITKANENQVKLMENQVRLQKEALEYQKENGVIWTKVYEVMNGSYDSILSFFSGNSNEFFKASALEQESMLLEWAKIIGIYDENRASEQASKDAASHWNDGTINSMFAMDKTLSEYKDAQGNVKTKTREQIYNELSDEDKKAAQEHYNMAYTDAILQGKTMDEAKKAAYNSMVERLRVDSNLGQVYWDPHGEGSGNSNGSFGDGQQVTYYGGYTADGTFIGGSGRFAYGSAAIAKQIAQNNKILVDQEGNFKTGSSPIQPWRKWYIEDANGFRLSSSVYDLKEQAEKAIKDKKDLLTGKSKLGIAISDEEMKWSRAVAKFYSKGGLVDYTGLAMVHGSKSKPEAFLNASQTAQIKEALEATNGKENLLQGLYSTISQLRSLIHSINTINNSNNYDVTIASGAVVINVDQLADSYDVETLSADIMNRMVSIASKATNRGVNRR